MASVIRECSPRRWHWQGDVSATAGGGSGPEWDESYALQGHQAGDPVKAVELIVDVVRGKGKAKGRRFPHYLPLGEEAGDAIREKTTSA